MTSLWPSARGLESRDAYSVAQLILSTVVFWREEGLVCPKLGKTNGWNQRWILIFDWDWFPVKKKKKIHNLFRRSLFDLQCWTWLWDFDVPELPAPKIQLSVSYESSSPLQTGPHLVHKRTNKLLGSELWSQGACLLLEINSVVPANLCLPEGRNVHGNRPQKKMVTC